MALSPSFVRKKDHCIFHTDPANLPDDIDESKALLEALEAAGESPFEEGPEHRGQFVGATFGAIDLTDETIGAEDYDIRFDHTKFRGDGDDITFEGVQFVTQGSESVSFQWAEFTTEGEGYLDFESAEFTTEGKGYLDFESAEFTTTGEGDLDFRSAEFTTEGEGDLVFEDAQFKTTGSNKIRFESVTFGGFGRLPGSSFEPRFYREATGDVLFTETTFDSEETVTFTDTNFTGDTHFSGVTFDCPVRFDDWFVDDLITLSFAGAEFLEECQFGSGDGPTEYQSTLDFSNVRFHKRVEFAGEAGDDEMGTMDLIFSGHVSFEKASLPDGTDFSRTRFPTSANFSRATLSGVNFSKADLSGASLERATLNRGELLGTNLIGTRLYGTLLGDARINHRTRFWQPSNASGDTEYTMSIRALFPPYSSPIHNNAPVIGRIPVLGTFYTRWKAWLRQGRVPYCRYDPRYDIIGFDTLPKRDDPTSDDEDNDEEQARLEKAAEVYGTIETLARDNSLQELASESFVGRKDVQRRQYWRKDEYGRQWLMWIRSIVPNTVARYGESPWRVLWAGLFAVLTSGLAYWAFDLIEQVDSGDPATFVESLYFSALTFTTLGYGDFRPANVYGQALAVSETATGVIMLAILVFVFGRRATR